MWSDSSKEALQKYLEEGTGGWIGFHHASLLGVFDGYPMWNGFPNLWVESNGKIISQPGQGQLFMWKTKTIR